MFDRVRKFIDSPLGSCFFIFIEILLFTIYYDLPVIPDVDSVAFGLVFGFCFSELPNALKIFSCGKKNA